MFTLARRVLLVAALAPAILVVGCGDKELVDPYVYGTLDQVTRGHLQSEQFLFEVDTPEFVFIDGNTGLVRIENRLEVVVAEDLENQVANWDGKILGVQKYYTPFVWLMARRVKTPEGEGFVTTDLDSVTNPLLPKFINVDLNEVNGYDIGKLRWNRKKDIDDMFEAKVSSAGTILYLPDHEADAAAAEPVEGEEGMMEPAMAWYLQAESSDAMFKITNVNDRLELYFRLLESENLPFIGEVSIGETYSYKNRKASRVSAPVEVNWLRFANRFMAP
ncbi:hypothetical protein DRQ53_05710 [bacterium]|nr:MAG: hypothetical protein DRQ53_05710 [bacterium]